MSNNYYTYTDDIQADDDMETGMSVNRHYEKSVSHCSVGILILFIVMTALVVTDCVYLFTYKSIAFNSISLPLSLYICLVFFYIIVVHPCEESYYYQRYVTRVWILDIIGGMGTAMLCCFFIEDTSTNITMVWIGLSLYLFVVLLFSISTHPKSIGIYTPLQDAVNCIFFILLYPLLFVLYYMYS
jgi:hypothetical protein